MLRRLFNKRPRDDRDSLVLKGVLDGKAAFTGPSIVQFDITNKCNNNCICCWNNSPLLGPQDENTRKELSSELPVELVKKTISDLKDMGTKTLFFAGGGEPFFHPGIMDILEFSKACGMKIFMNTNFTLIDEKIAKRLVELKVDHIHVSLLAGSGETYAGIHPNKSEETFERMKDILKYISFLKIEKDQHLHNPLPHINLYYVIFNRNYHEIDAMVDLAVDVKADSVEFTPVDVIPGKTECLLMNEAQAAQVAERVRYQFGRLEAYNKNEPIKTYIAQKDSFIKRISSSFAKEGKYEAETITKQPCYVGWAFARISATGDVHPCLKAHKLSVGNIYDEPFAKIWNGPQQQLFRDKTFSLDFNDPYFEKIGNDPNCPSGCLKACDNLQINLELDNKFRDTLKKHGKT